MSRTIRNLTRSFACAAALALTFTAACPEASATPLLFAGKGSEKASSHQAQVVIMKSGETTAVTVMPDYQGPVTPFALVTVVPSDVDAEHVTTLKREFVDRVDTISAPRFSEFWEMDPCEPGKTEQEWERDLKATGPGIMGEVNLGPTKKVAKELLMDVDAQKKEGEYTIKILDSWDALSKHFDSKGYKAPEGAEAALKPYLDAGQKILVADVDPNRIELVGGDRAQLSPIRFWTDTPYDTIPARLGLVSAPAQDQQELFVYVLAPKDRFEVANYPTKYAPTNLTVDFKVKERMGEFYAALHDIYLQKHPGTFLTEYVWSAEGCGQPCAAEGLMVHELMSLGGDAIDAKLPDDVRNPDPGKPTEEEKKEFEASLEGKKPKEKAEAKKTWEQDRKTIAARKALTERQKYVLTRLHYRYGKDMLAQDPKLAVAAGGVEGGLALPEGKEGAASTDTKAASDYRFQTRYNNLHPNQTVVKCDNPEPHRWGKAPRTYRGLRKIWVAEDLTRRNRKQIKPTEVVITQVPDLGLGVAAAPAPTKVDANAATPEEKKSGCGCHVVGAEAGSALGAGATMLAGLGAFWRRRRSVKAAK
jgi:hypothetical protein